MDSESKKVELQEKMKLFNDIKKIVSEGKTKTETERDGSISKTQKLKGIRDNQKKEREIHRNLNKEEKVETFPSSEESYIFLEDEEDLEIFRSLREMGEEE